MSEENKINKPVIDTRKMLYVDYDGVIYDTITALAELYNEDFKYYEDFQPASVSNLHKYDMSDMCPLATHEQIIHYFSTAHLYNNYHARLLNSNIVNALTKMGYTLTCVTIGTIANLRIKQQWLNQLSLQNLVGFNENTEDKSEFDMSDGILIDDSWKNLVTSNAKYKIHFGTTKDWDKEFEAMAITDDYIQCDDWAEIFNTLGELE